MSNLATCEAFRERSWRGKATLLHVKEVRNYLPREEGVIDHAVEDGPEDKHVPREGRSNTDGANGPQENEQRVQWIRKAELHMQ